MTSPPNICLFSVAAQYGTTPGDLLYFNFFFFYYPHQTWWLSFVKQVCYWVLSLSFLSLGFESALCTCVSFDMVYHSLGKYGTVN